MKLIHFSFIVLLVLNTTLFSAAVPKIEKNFDYVRGCYLRCLDSENAGVRNSTILQLVKLKTIYPEKNFHPVVKKLDKISQSDSQLYIRLHARLTVAIIADPELIRGLNPNNYEDPTQFFSDFYLKLAQSQIVSVK